MKDTIKAIAFDIDGTLYPSLKFYLRVAPYAFRHLSFFIAYNKARKILHRTAPLIDFYEYQARLLVDFMPSAKGKSKQMIQQIVYDGLKPYFEKTKPFPYVLDFIKNCKNAGLKVGLLSDFPPEQKGDIWGATKYCDAIRGSEASGALKPSIYAFGQLQLDLAVPFEQILYVGNNIRSDIDGAHNAGMKTAFIQTGFYKLFNIKPKNADICFRNYRQLNEIVLK